MLRPVLLLSLLGPLLAQQASPPAPTSLASVSPDDPVLARLFDGGEPENPADLLVLQRHVQQLLQQVLPAMVSVPGASGVIVEGNLVLTAGHVVRTSGRRLSITMHDGRRLEGETLGADLTADTGLIKILTPGEYPSCAMADTAAVRAGDWCLMLGHPSGRKPGRDAPARLGRVLRPAKQGFLVSDCTMQGGDSGGPLFDMQGRVIGINSRITGDLANNMHVPIDAFRAGWEQLLAGKVSGQPSGQRGRQRVELALPLEWRGEQLVVGEVDAALQQRGLQAGDVIAKVDGEAISSRRDLGRALVGFAPDALVKVEVVRGEQTHELELPLRRAGR